MRSKKYYSALDGLDRRNGHREGIVCGGELCYTWVSKLINKFELRGNYQMNFIDKAFDRTPENLKGFLLRGLF